MKRLQLIPCGGCEKDVQQIESVVNEFERVAMLTVEPVAEPLRYFYLGLVGANGFKRLALDCLRMA